MEIDGETSSVAPGDAILIPPGAWHQITASTSSAFSAAARLLFARGHLFHLAVAGLAMNEP
jgi:quercetin dioxygenase-like cupin family protein